MWCIKLNASLINGLYPFISPLTLRHCKSFMLWQELNSKTAQSTPLTIGSLLVQYLPRVGTSPSPIVIHVSFFSTQPFTSIIITQCKQTLAVYYMYIHESILLQIFTSLKSFQMVWFFFFFEFYHINGSEKNFDEKMNKYTWSLVD